MTLLLTTTLLLTLALSRYYTQLYNQVARGSKRWCENIGAGSLNVMQVKISFVYERLVIVNSSINYNFGKSRLCFSVSDL